MAVSDASPRSFTERKLVLFVVDLAGTSRAVARLDAERIAELINAFFTVCAAAVESNGGRVVKYLGDGCFAVFDEDAGARAIDAALALRGSTEDLWRDFDIDVELGVNIHQAVVAEGLFAPDDRYDVMGTGVIHTFRMGGGPGLRISEPVYRQLPSDRRSPWRKHRPPATYTFDDDAS